MAKTHIHGLYPNGCEPCSNHNKNNTGFSLLRISQMGHRSPQVSLIICSCVRHCYARNYSFRHRGRNWSTAAADRAAQAGPKVSVIVRMSLSNLLDSGWIVGEGQLCATEAGKVHLVSSWNGQPTGDFPESQEYLKHYIY